MPKKQIDLFGNIIERYRSKLEELEAEEQRKLENENAIKLMKEKKKLEKYKSQVSEEPEGVKIKLLKKEFKVNEFISLKLEDKDTIIYVKGKRFIQCKFLLLNISTDQVQSFDDIESIDEAAERLDKSLERRKKNMKIPPETEFWGHCSNLQAWCEYNYNTRLLHSNIAFPLLKKLTESGDQLAKDVFKKEILSRLESGYLPVIAYLITENYLSYLDSGELHALMMKDVLRGNSLLVLYLIKHNYISYFSRSEVRALIMEDKFWQSIYRAIKKMRGVIAMSLPAIVAKKQCDLLENLLEMVQEYNGWKKIANLINIFKYIPESGEKYYSFLSLLSTIKKRKSLMRENFAHLVTIVKNWKVRPSGYGRHLFSELVSIVIKTDGMEEKFADLVGMVESMPLVQNKVYIFSTLLFRIKGTHFLEIYYSPLKNIFFELLSLLESLSSDNKASALASLINGIIGTGLMKENFIDFLNLIFNTSDRTYDNDLFRVFINSIYHTGLMEENFMDIVAMIKDLSNNRDKQDAISLLISRINLMKGKEVKKKLLEKIEELQNEN